MESPVKLHRGGKLRTALAINRGIEFLGNFSPKSNVTQTQWGSYLEELYRQIYSRLFSDTTSTSPQQRLVGLVQNAEKANAIGEIFKDFTSDFFDPNGFFASTDRVSNAHRLATLYAQLERAEPFPDYNSLTLRVLFTAMGRMRGFREKVAGIDFRRLSNDEVEILIDPDKRIEDLARLFESAMDPLRDPSYPSDITPHMRWQDRSITILGKRFIQAAPGTPLELWRTPVEGEALVVLITGEVVEESVLKNLLAAHMEAGHLLGSLRIPHDVCVGRLAQLGNDIKGKPIASKERIDYIDVTAGAPPICMSLHPLSQLTHSQHMRLENYLREEFNARMLDLSDRALARAVRNSIKGYPRAEQMLDVALERIHEIVQSMRESVEEELARCPQARVEDEQAELVMTMGGSGSGKGSNAYFNRRYKDANGNISRNYIYASLDEGRPYSDIYHVLVAAGHHADDYEAVHVWADTRRNWLCDRARERNYNVIYDGSGIDYAGRYDKIVAQFARANYLTTIVAADCLLFSPPDRPDIVGAIDRIKSRAGYRPDGSALPAEEGPYRTLPWRVAINKHIGLPASLLAAVADSHIDKLVLVDNAGPKGTDYVMAERFTITDDQMDILDTAQTKGKLLYALKTENLLPAQNNVSQLDEENCGFLARRVNGVNQVLVIVNLERMVDVIEKGQLNPNAHGPDNLSLVKHNASFVVDRIDKPDGVMTVPAAIESRYQTSLKGANGPITRPNYLRLNHGTA